MVSFLLLWTKSVLVSKSGSCDNLVYGWTITRPRAIYKLLLRCHRFTSPHFTGLSWRINDLRFLCPLPLPYITQPTTNAEATFSTTACVISGVSGLAALIRDGATLRDLTASIIVFTPSPVFVSKNTLFHREARKSWRYLRGPPQQHYSLFERTLLLVALILPVRGPSSRFNNGRMAALGRLKKDPPSFSVLAQDLATVFVGPEGKAYHAHMGLLVHYSEYFRAAFTGSFKEAEKKELTLDEVEERTFGFFMDWLYSKKLPEDCGSGERSSIYPPQPCTCNEDEGRYPLVKLYIFADRYQIPNFRKDVLDVIFQRYNRDDMFDLHSNVEVIEAFESLLPNSPLCRFYIDLFARRYYPIKWDTDGDDRLSAHLPHAYLYGVMQEMGRLLHGTAVNKMELCDYHEHVDEERVACEAAHKIADITQFEV
ncbi:hypothetical protein BU16DRAFT_143700 [Lophium mytilinum]|uniref:BTB domain-containing protein n=1 Tax=Lophium mytilinum TaxID=390894 RepID=A0A6A6QFQ1_9PEZI|nr:hypothetical protein BU16DRAFT_143700 [Lophium mytilinum]